MNKFQKKAMTKKMAIMTATAGEPLRSSGRSIHTVAFVMVVVLIEWFKQLNVTGSEDQLVAISVWEQGGCRWENKKNGEGSHHNIWSNVSWY